MKKFKTTSNLETIELGVKIGNIVKETKAIILLKGDLASGKTTLTKGIAKGLGINEIIKSPTFTIMKEYQINESKTLYHLDLYRLNEIGFDFDLEEYIYNENSIVVIEWPTQVLELLPEEYLLVNLSGNQDERKIIISGVGEKYEKLVSLLWKN